MKSNILLVCLFAITQAKLKILSPVSLASQFKGNVNFD